MSAFINKPNLPNNKTLYAVAGELPESVKRDLNHLSVNLLNIEKSSQLNENLSFHPDLQCIHLGENRILLSSEQEKLGQKLKELGFHIDFLEGIKEKYPYDCIVNTAIIGRNAICKQSITSNKLLDYFNKEGIEIINVNQGYSRCSACIVDENSIITEDESIKNACEKHGIDVLLICKGYVSLHGFGYGFIGGASFKYDKDTLTFIGKVENHPDFLKIKRFLDMRNIDFISLGDCELTDIGGILPIMEI